MYLEKEDVTVIGQIVKEEAFVKRCDQSVTLEPKLRTAIGKPLYLSE